MKTLIITHDCDEITACGTLPELERVAEALVAARPNVQVIDAAAGDLCRYPSTRGHFWRQSMADEGVMAGEMGSEHDCGVHTIQISQPQCNGRVERLIRTLRQECLNHLIILDGEHLRWVLEEFLAYYHRSRPHQGPNQETPLPQPRLLSSDCTVRSRPVLGGIHHEYYRTAA